MRFPQTTLARGLNLVLHLIEQDFLLDANDGERALVDATLDRVRPHPGSIDALKRERMERLHAVISRAGTPWSPARS